MNGPRPHPIWSAADRCSTVTPVCVKVRVTVPEV